VNDPLLDRVRRALAPDFDVERLIAAGGMGQVYLGAERALDRPVAIKIVRPELATAQAVERFLREARTLAALAHPHIVPIHRVGVRDGIAYYVMDYLAGETLAERLARGPLAPAVVVRIARDVLAALAAAHERGIVHRDVKPGNIFLVADRAVLTDFGIAKGVGGLALTQTGGVVGTPAYMSPEQLTAGDVTAATDLYALGMVLYQALTGREWTPVTPPEHGDWRGVPHGLGGALRRALAVAPEHRWSSATAFAAALRRRRRRALLPWVVVAAVALVAAWLLWPRPRPPAVPDVAILRFRGATPADSTVGEDVARTTYEILRTYDRITLAPAATLAGGAAPRAAYVVDGELERRDGAITLHLRVRDSLGAVSATAPALRAPPGWGAGEAAALAILEAVTRRPFPPSTACRPATVEAYDAWLDGQEAFQRGDLEGADLGFRRAVDRDPRFCIAQFQLWMVERWRRVPVSVDLAALLAAHGERLPDGDRLLVQAEVAPTRAERRARYEQAVHADRFSGYGPLLYGAELFHRGPLDGLPADGGVPWLREALRRDRSLGPAHDQLVWALIALGRRAEARAALDSLRAAVADPAARSIDPGLLEFAFAARFDTAGGLGATLGAAGPRGLVDMLRLGLAFDAAPAQYALGLALAGRPDAPPPLRAHGLVAAGLAAIELGRPLAGLALLDSAAALQPAVALPAVEFRALAPAIGLPGATAAMAQAARQRLAAWPRDGAARARAAWAWGVSTLATGDSSGVGAALAVVRRANPGLASLLEGLRLGARDPRGALRLTGQLRGGAWEERDGPGDPFARALVHRARADWLDALGDAAAAERERRWYENSDFTGWLQGEIQAAEVDWAAGVYVRYAAALRRARAGDARGCADLRRVLALWTAPEAAVAALVAAARPVADACP
jgi:hypothetical protein